MPSCKLCIDFSHIHARGIGALKEYKDMIEKFNHNAHIVNCIGKEGTNMNFNKERIINRMMG